MAAAKSISADALRALLAYDQGSGLFTWNTARGPRWAGRAAGSLKTTGYMEIRLSGGRYLAHRLAWLYIHGAMPIGEIDHINGEKTDNRIANLRDVSHVVNAQNRTRTNRSNKSGELGVWLHERGYWGACIQASGVRRHLGYFQTKDEARTAYLAAKSELHPSA